MHSIHTVIYYLSLFPFFVFSSYIYYIIHIIMYSTVLIINFVWASTCALSKIKGNTPYMTLYNFQTYIIIYNLYKLIELIV